MRLNNSQKKAKNRVFNWVSGMRYAGFNIVTGKPILKIGTFEGEMTAELGDWTIKGIKGEFYPCKPDIFEATYEKVEGE